MEDNKKTNKITLSTYIAILAVLIIVVMAGFIYMQKLNSDREIAGLKTDAEELKATVTELQGKLDNTSDIANEEENSEKKANNTAENKVSAKTNTVNTNSTASNNSTTTQNVKYEFVSVDSAAMRGHGRILKIYEKSKNELVFNYNSGFDFETSSIDREIKGTARAYTEQKYEFEENVSGHKYKVVFEFSENMDEVKVIEYDNNNEMGEINLLAN